MINEAKNEEVTSALRQCLKDLTISTFLPRPVCRAIGTGTTSFHGRMPRVIGTALGIKVHSVDLHAISRWLLMEELSGCESCIFMLVIVTDC